MIDDDSGTSTTCYSDKTWSRDSTHDDVTCSSDVALIDESNGNVTERRSCQHLRHTHTHIVLLTYTLTVHIQWRDTRVTAAQSLNQHRALHQD